MLYPKMGTLFKLEAGADGRWWRAIDEPLPDTAGLLFVPPERRAWTEKLDGSNMWVELSRDGIRRTWAGWRARTAANGLEYLIGKKNAEVGLDDPGDAFYAEVAQRFIGTEVRDALAKFQLEHVTLFGELVGPKVQSSGRLFAERRMVLFDVYDHATDKFFRWPAVKDFACAAGVGHVPELPIDAPLDFNTVRDVVLGLKSSVNRPVDAEGVVIRDVDDTSPVRRRIAKIRRRDFRGA